MRFFKRVAGWVAAGLLAASAVGSLAQAQTVTVTQGAATHVGWPRDSTDLPHDPDYTLGELPNGMRYLILPNQTPPRQVAIRLLIDAGAMQERPGEEGVAHFLEHLAFRGTTNYPDGEVQRVLEGIGLQMAADMNASTGPDTTTFMIDLPRNNPESLQIGLDVMRDLVGEMLLQPDKVDAERGVILAEERARAGPGLQAATAMLKMQVGDHPYGRPPIGLRSVIEKVSAETIRGYYDAFYRPERATLVIVGDVSVAQIVPMITANFADWRGRGAPGKDPLPVTTKPATPDVAMLITPGAPDTSVMMRWFEPYTERAHTKAERRRMFIEMIASRVISYRMLGINEAAGKPARSLGNASSSSIHGVWRGQVAYSSGVIDLPKTIELMVGAHRQAVDFGITQEELDRQRTLVLDATRREAERGRTGTSVAQVETAASYVSSDIPFMSLQQQYQLLAEQAPTITLAEVNAMLKTRFSKDTPVLIYSGSAPPAGGEQGLRDALKRAMAAPVKAYVPAAIKPWPYTNFGAAGVVASRQYVEDLGVTLVKFENGVKLTVKQMPTNKDLISVRVRIGGGRLQMPMNVIDASDMGLSLWSSGGLGKLTPTEQARTLAGKRAAAIARTLDDAYALDNMNVATREDFGLQMELMTAMLSDPAYRADDWASWMQQADAADASMLMTPSGVLERELDRLLHDGDLRWTINNKAMRDTWKPEDSIKYIKPIVDNSPIEVVVVGDISVEQVINETARTLGALPPRPPFKIPPAWVDVDFPDAGTTVLPHEGRPDQGYVLIGWPTYQGAFKNIREERIANVLGQMLRDNATRLFRSEGGATYSPMEIVDISTFLPDYGFIAVAIEVPPETLDDVQNRIQGLATDLATYAQAQSEIDRIVQPRLEQVRRNIVTNVGYWMELLSNAHDDPGGMEYIRTEMKDYASITPEEVRAAARKWFKPETAWRLKIVPGPGVQ
jgi:zinc protease